MHNLEIEKSVLGGLINSPNWFDQVSADLTSHHFFDPKHRTIFSAMSSVLQKDMQLDRATLKYFLGDGDISSYVDELVHKYAYVTEAVQHSNLIKEMWGKRRLKKAVGDVSTFLDTEGSKTLEETIENAQSLLTDALSFDGKEKHTRSYKDILPSYLGMLKTRMETDGNVSGLSTGFETLDEFTSGLFPHQLILLAARPAMGKSAMAINIAERATQRGDCHAIVFSLEMKGEELLQRSVASLATIHMGNLKNGTLTNHEVSNLELHHEKIESTKITVNDMPDATPAKIRAEALQLKRELESKGEKLGLIVIDYLQLMSDTGFGPNDRTAEVSSISRKLKKLAGELDLPIIALSQLNRDLEKRPNKRPIVSDLRESGALEQDSDLILFLYRDEVYYPDSEAKGTAELIIGKQRSGPLGTIHLKFEGQYSRFQNMVKKDEVPEIGVDVERPNPFLNGKEIPNLANGEEAPF